MPEKVERYYGATGSLMVRASDYDALLAENERLRGLMPELPPRPPDGSGLPRYGLRWNGPGQPLSMPMDDGYWTPWHLADELRAELEAVRSALAGDGRDEFEAMCRSQHRNITRDDRPDPPLAWGYANSLTHDRWCGWAAAWKRMRALVACLQGGES
ncbi:hypothetical protein D9M68_693720 [compost metagenome]